MKHNILMASAIALALSGTAYGDNQTSARGQYDTAVSYPDYRNSSTYALRASELIGRDVRNATDEVIGEVDDIIVSREGEAVQAVVSVGGFLGIGARLVLVPYEDLRVTPDGEHIYYNATKDDLTNRAAFEYADDDAAARTPDGSAEANPIARVDTGDPETDTEVKDADDTSRNVRDRDDKTLTPIDQSGAQADVDITRAIRKELVANESLSVNAENIKVITVNGKVTLRGPVESGSERSKIVDVAKQVAGADRVQDELEVTNR